MMKTRTESDTMGTIEVPADRLWGAQTQRSIENFPIGPPASMPSEVIRAFGILKKAAALTNEQLGILSSDKAEQISHACDEIIGGTLDEHFPLVIWQTGSGTQTNMNVNEVIANRCHQLTGGKLGESSRAVHPNDDVNLSQSSNDTFPTAMHIAAYSMIVDQLLPSIEGLVTTLRKKAGHFRDIVKIGRTHFMDATPLTLGQEFSGYVAQLEMGLKSIRNGLPSLAELALGGTAVGTGLNAPEGYSETVAEKIARLTGHPFVTAPNKFAALAAHDAIVASHGDLRLVAVSLSKIANDIRMLASGPRCGIGEIALPANEPGSSIMPGKVNPTQIEALLMVCARVIGNDTTMSVAGASGQFELNVYKPLLAATFLESASLLSDGCRSFEQRCVSGIEPVPERIDEHLRNSLMLVTALNRHIGYDRAATIAKKAHSEGITLKEAALSIGGISETDFDQWVDPASMVGLSLSSKSNPGV